MNARVGLRSRVRRLWQRLADAVSYTPPTSTEIATVAKSGLAAGLSWWVATVFTDVPGPVLAPLTALAVVQFSVRASFFTAVQRSLGVVLGVLVALVIGDALSLNGLTVGLLVAGSLAIAELIVRLPPASARQVPISVLAVLATVTADPVTFGGQRALETVLGAAVGVAVSLVLPASRMVDARQTFERLALSLGEVLDAMGGGLQEAWSTDQTEDWRRRARTARDRLVRQAIEAVGNGRESARWNVRDRQHIDVLGRYEDAMPRLERTAIGVSVISRGLDDHAHLGGTTHRAMPAMGALMIALADAVREFVHEVLGDAQDADLARALQEVKIKRDRCALGAARRARLALEHDESLDYDQLEGEWLGYAALIVQVERIVADLSAPLPA